MIFRRLINRFLDWICDLAGIDIVIDGDLITPDE